MTWLRSDDQDAFAPSVLAAGNAAVGAHYRMRCWSAAQLTDGAVPRGIASIIATVDELVALVRVGLLVDHGDSFELVGFLDLNPTREKVLADREARRAGGQEGARRRWGADGSTQSRTHGSTNGSTNGSAQGGTHTNVNAPVPARPGPTPPDPDPEKKERERGESAERGGNGTPSRSGEIPREGEGTEGKRAEKATRSSAKARPPKPAAIPSDTAATPAKVSNGKNRSPFEGEDTTVQVAVWHLQQGKAPSASQAEALRAAFVRRPELHPAAKTAYELGVSRLDEKGREQFNRDLKAVGL